MIRALYSAASGMTAQQMNIDNIANNLANANTVGFKARRAQFQDLIYQNVIQPGAAAGSQTTVPSGLQLGFGHAAGFERDRLYPGRFPADGQPSRPGDPGQGLLPDPAALGRPGLHAGRPFPTGPQREHGDGAGQRARAADHHPEQRAIGDHRPGRHGQLHAARADRGADRRPDPARQLRESGGTELARRQPVPAHRRLGRSGDGQPGRAGRASARCSRATWSNPM